MSAKRSTLRYALHAQSPSSSASAGNSSSKSRWPIDIRSNRSASTERLQHVTDAVHGPDHEALALELAAQPMHVHFDRVVADRAVALAELLAEPRLAHDLTRPLHQRGEHVELALRQRERRSAQPRELSGVDVQRAVDQRLLAAVSAADQRGDARLELLERERFGEIVVGAEAQAEHAILEA